MEYVLKNKRNYEGTQTVDLVFKEYKDVQVAVIMLGAISVGVIIGYGVAVTNI